MNQLLDYFAKMELNVVRTIPPQDEIFNHARKGSPDDNAAAAFYFLTGRELATGLLKYLHNVGLNPAELDLLDFAAGYGRVTRWMVPAFRTVTMADLEIEMVDFHKDQYGISGFLSGEDPSTLASHERRYDVIFVFSLFTHLPPSSWKLWLSALSNLVRSGGHLVFSTHSYELFALLFPQKYGEKNKWVEEFCFLEVNETNNRLKTESYGCNIVKDSYIRTAVDELRNFKVVQHFKMGEFDRYHDIYITRKGDELPSSSA